MDLMDFWPSPSMIPKGSALKTFEVTSLARCVTREVLQDICTISKVGCARTRSKMEPTPLTPESDRKQLTWFLAKAYDGPKEIYPDDD
jgi:hypothetical protein